MKILSITVRKEIDTDPDTSYLGRYSNDPGPDSIDREARGDMGRNEYRYFIPGMTAEETGNPESPEQDYQRSEALNRGDWNYIGLWAEAEAQLTNNGPVQTIRSGGLWGVESDSGEYLAEIAKEELSQLRDELEAMGFAKKDIDEAFADVEM